MELADVIAALNEAVPGAGATSYPTANGDAIVVKSAAIIDVLRYLHEAPQQSFEMLADLTCVDREAESGEIEILYVLRSLSRGVRLSVKTCVAADAPVVASATVLWKAANWAEREAWDMFGVRFEGHPDLRRILMYEEFVGHPLRKSYPYQKRQPLVEERDPIANPWPAR